MPPKRGYSREFTPKTERRVRFEVDRIPPTLYDAVKAKARREGVSLRTLTLRLWSEWLSAEKAGSAPSAAPAATPEAPKPIHRYGGNHMSLCGRPVQRGESSPELNHTDCEACFQAWHRGVRPTSNGPGVPVPPSTPEAPRGE